MTKSTKERLLWTSVAGKLLDLVGKVAEDGRSKDGDDDAAVQAVSLLLVMLRDGALPDARNDENLRVALNSLSVAVATESKTKAKPKPKPKGTSAALLQKVSSVSPVCFPASHTTNLQYRGMRN